MNWQFCLLIYIKGIFMIKFLLTCVVCAAGSLAIMQQLQKANLETNGEIVICCFICLLVATLHDKK
jgi:hypothetical protein